ncbi:MAG: DUF4446 family protein [Candidatus Limnocylindrales bacterium]
MSLLLSLLALMRVRASGQRRAVTNALGADPSADAERIAALGAQVADIGRRLAAVESQGQRAIQRVGVVRFNPFADTGSNQSFVLAMLDARGDGFVLSSMHSRQQTRVFLKWVASGKAETALSEEETEAIRRATSG